MFDRIRAAWRAFWATTTAISTPEPKAPMRIAPQVSMAADWESRRHGAPRFTPDTTFARAVPMPKVLPEGMAMDYTLPSLDQITAAAYAAQVSEGLGFLGFPYLAELSQRAEYRKIASIWAKNCVRKWIKLSGPEAKTKAIEAELIRLDARETFRKAIEKECYFGRCQVFFDFDDYDRPGELGARLMIDPAKINPDRPIQRLSIIEPMWSYPGRYDAQNPLAPDFYKPSTWYVSGRTVHASRLITMVGHEMPTMLKPAYAFGGVALTQMCKPYVDNWLRVRQSASDLVNAFSIMVLKTEMSDVLVGGSGDELFTRIDVFNKTRDNRGTFVLDKNAEDFSNVSAPIAGLDKLVAQSQEQMSSVSSIPLSVLLGITPTGLNASADGEIRIFYDSILSYLNEVVRPGLETLLDIVQLSLFGEIDDEITAEFETLWEMSDKDKADIRKSDAEAAVAYINGGVIDPEEERERLNNEDGGAYNGMLDGPAPEPPEVDPMDDENEAAKLPILP
jgi:phage-related protein (TIGR01555 family)